MVLATKGRDVLLVNQINSRWL